MAPEKFLDGRVTLHAGDCLAVLDTLPDSSIDACVTDPPYHLASIVKRFGKDGSAPALAYEGDATRTGAFARASSGFMGKAWDGGDIAFRSETWAKVLRVLKPGGHLLAFTASKQVGLQQAAIVDAGFEQTRDVILDLIDADARVADFLNSLTDEQRGAFFRIMEEGDDAGGLLAWIYGSGFPKNHNVALDYEKRLCTQIQRGGRNVWIYSDGKEMARQAPFRHPLAQQFAGYGSALKPAFEPIIMARKPLIGSIAENVEAFGTGAINIDGCRVPGAKPDTTRGASLNASSMRGTLGEQGRILDDGNGRYPANVIHDGSVAAVAAFPADAGAQSSVTGNEPSACFGGVYSGPKQRQAAPARGDTGSAARFFYSSKAGDDDRLGSKHPTVKPVDLMQWCVRLVTAPGQTVLDLFAGTGTTGEAAFREGRRAILIEREAEYQADIRRRMALCLAGPDERRRETIKQKTPPKPFEAGTLFATEQDE